VVKLVPVSHANWREADAETAVVKDGAGVQNCSSEELMFPGISTNSTKERKSERVVLNATWLTR